MGAHPFSRRPARPVDEGIRSLDTGVHMVSIARLNGRVKRNISYSMDSDYATDFSADSRKPLTIQPWPFTLVNRLKRLASAVRFRPAPPATANPYESDHSRPSKLVTVHVGEIL